MKTEEITKLRDDVADGGITLVLGSGINHGAGLPNWSDLLDKVAESRPIWKKEVEKLAAKNSARQGKGESVDILDLIKLFEQLRYTQRGGVAEKEGFIKKLQAAVYQDDKDKSPDDAKSLKAIGDVIIKDRESGCPRIRRVISLNIDSLLEEYLLDQGSIQSHPITHWYQSAMHYHPSIDIYHLHGFLPSESYNRTVGHLKKFQATPGSLVFGDDEYWDMTSRPSSLPNVVMMNALHDSHCVFIGLSMKDPNIARWLALRTNEIKNSKRNQTGNLKTITQLLSKHYWFEKYPDQLTAYWLKSRGVRTISMDTWNDFPDIFRGIFNPSEIKEN